MTDETVVGVIGGSGLYELEGLIDIEEVLLTTPFGSPSDAYITGRLDGVRMVFLPRHGRGHKVTPSEINYRANVWGMKSLGVTHVASMSAVGSMREDIAPGDFVVIDQFIDRTRHRADTFFGDGVVAHVMFGDPVCGEVRKALRMACEESGVKTHIAGTYICMEGPMFSTRAESNTYRQWGVDVIGMTNLTEAKLAREAELCYATVAMATDYDCWHDGHDDVSADAVMQVMAKNVGNAREVVRRVVPHLVRAGSCGCRNALQHAIVTDPASISAEARTRLGLLIDRHIQK